MSRVPPYSRHVRTVPPLSPTGLSPAVAARSSGLRLEGGFLTVWERYRAPLDPVQPRRRNGGTLGTPTVWACTVSLAATPAPFYFLRVREMFQFPGLPPPPLCVHGGVTRLITSRGFPIRTSSAPSPRAAPRGISLLRHVLHRHERPRHPPNALRHGHTLSAGSPPSPHARVTLLPALYPSAHQHPKASACALLPRLPSSTGKVLRSVSSLRMRRYHCDGSVSRPFGRHTVKRLNALARVHFIFTTNRSFSWIVRGNHWRGIPQCDAENARHISLSVVFFNSTCVSVGA